MNAILITQCLQNDFVCPLGPQDPIPNLLHVGGAEAKRLMGETPQTGPVSRLMSWAQAQASEILKVIHLRDWHDPQDPAQKPHLERFGNHCLQGSKGAQFAFEVTRDSDTVIDSLSLNDFQATCLSEHLSSLNFSPTRVGVVGVWTEAKVHYLCYELKTRYPQIDLAVCSALTASSSRARHFDALDQIQRILGVRVIHSVGEFIDFLGGEDFETPLLGGGVGAHLELTSSEKLSADDETLVRYLFRDCRRIRVRVLDGGFSGNIVLGTESEDMYGHQQVPHVLKIGPQNLMGQERVAFERIQNVLGNNAPQVSDFADYGERGAIKYRYASMGGDFTTSFQSLVEQGRPQEEINRVLKEVFSQQLNRLYRAKLLEDIDLLEQYQFSPKWAKSVREKVEDLTSSAAGGSLRLLDGLQTPNLCLFYEEQLENLQRGGRCFQSYVHGDLNGANIILDDHSNVWLIDFFHTKRAHVLTDLIKLENDLLYIFTKLENKEDLLEACRLFDELLALEDLAAGLPQRSFLQKKFQRCWDTLRCLRSFYAPLVESDRSPYQWWVGALRYAAHSLGFDECSRLQKLFALYAAGHLSAKIVAQDKAVRKLRVDWMPTKFTAPGAVGLTILPGRLDRDRCLVSDLDDLQEMGISAVACLVPQQELESYGVENLLSSYEDRQMAVYHQPVVDQRICSLAELQDLVTWMKAKLKSGQKVLCHCVGGLGRSGFAVAALLVDEGLSACEAIAVVRENRSPRAIETRIQEDFVTNYDFSSRKPRT